MYRYLVAFIAAVIVAVVFFVLAAWGTL